MNQSPWQADQLNTLPQLATLFQKRWHGLTFADTKANLRELKTAKEKLDWLRTNKVGRLTMIPVPHHWATLGLARPGNAYRSMLHLDYTASAQGLEAIENYISECLCTYANTHTETSATGKLSTQRFHLAIETIRSHVGAEGDSFVVPSGFGATGAIEKVQKILGLYLSPKGQTLIQEHLGIDIKALMSKKVVVFVGPYEHHSNDVSWQDSALCHFVRIKALRHGPSINDIDLEDLEQQLKQYPDYLKIGSFSAASNVTGFRSDLKTLGEVLHKHKSLFFVDYAACSPYADINMVRDGIDAIYLSVHKNLGGSNLGFLVGRRHIYDINVHPSFGGGGTVSAVTPWEYYFHDSIEERESAGTPAIRQTWQAALSFQIKDWLGRDTIHQLEHAVCKQMMAFFAAHPKLQLLGNSNPEKRYPIFSFLVKHGQRMFHHTYVAVLLNDFFGVQARSGCACAGPFGHELLQIEREQSSKYVDLILQILNGFKPGWTRIGLHYTLSAEEIAYTQKTLSAIAWFGALFLDLYTFDPYTGDWMHESARTETLRFDFDEVLKIADGGTLLPKLKDEEQLYASFGNQLEEFYALASLRVAQLVLEEATKLAMSFSDDKKDVLASGFYPIIRNHIESLSVNEEGLLETLADHACTSLLPPQKDKSECRTQIKSMIDGIIAHPEKLKDRYESFATIDPTIAFFYVRSGKLSRPIVIEDKPTACRPCTTSANR
ncbi:MAG: aminotransferase class V-fold PLP-dependent enzyme [Chitinophagaceae bacterium]|nr:aminotransferase class V-fold PLP-dependent enzyme [Oligoflexus sp.]